MAEIFSYLLFQLLFGMFLAILFLIKVSVLAGPVLISLYLTRAVPGRLLRIIGKQRVDFHRDTEGN